jgi:hypothetical protein
MTTLQEKLLMEFRVRLATDPHLRRDFDSAPLGTLKRNGVQVTPAQARLIHLQVARGPARPPVTTLALRGEVPGHNGWLLAPVTVLLSAQDFSGTGIAVIETRLDQLAWTPYTGPFAYAAEGTTRLYYRARDNALGLEQPRYHDFKIDTRPPTIAISIDHPTTTRLEPFTAQFSATDPTPGSGLASVAATLDGTTVSNHQTVDLLWYPLGTHTLSVTASDIAGNSATRSGSFELIATKASLLGLIRRFTAVGEIDSAGVANSLLVKVEHEQYDALLHEIHAQSGKHISVRAADILRGDVEYVMSHS